MKPSNTFGSNNHLDHNGDYKLSDLSEIIPNIKELPSMIKQGESLYEYLNTGESVDGVNNRNLSAVICYDLLYKSSVSFHRIIKWSLTNGGEFDSSSLDKIKYVSLNDYNKLFEMLEKCLESLLSNREIKFPNKETYLKHINLLSGIGRPYCGNFVDKSKFDGLEPINDLINKFIDSCMKCLEISISLFKLSKPGIVESIYSDKDIEIYLPKKHKFNFVEMFIQTLDVLLSLRFVLDCLITNRLSLCIDDDYTHLIESYKSLINRRIPNTPLEELKSIKYCP